MKDAATPQTRPVRLRYTEQAGAPSGNKRRSHGSLGVAPSPNTTHDSRDLAHRMMKDDLLTQTCGVWQDGESEA